MGDRGKSSEKKGQSTKYKMKIKYNTPLKYKVTDMSGKKKVMQ